MRVAVGTARIAFIGESHTLKIPRIYPIEGTKQLIRVAKEGISIIKRELKYHIDAPGTFKYLLLRGIQENRREYRLSQRLQGLVVPTRFSFLGIFNIQATAKPHNLTVKELYDGVVKKLGSNIWKDNHLFTDVNNFGIYKGQLKLIDYGGIKSEEFLLEYRRLIGESLDELSKVLE